VIERYVFLEDDHYVLDRRRGSRPENQLPAESALVCGAAFAPVIVVPTARPAPKTVAAATAA
jgi:hypothetical protein